MMNPRKLQLLAVTLLFLWAGMVPAVAGTFAVDSRDEARQLVAKIRASQFLSKATFGPTTESVQGLAARILQVGYRRACGEWIDQQLDQPISFQRERIFEIFAVDGIEHTADVDPTRVRHQAWWDIALRGNDQLRQKFAWALSQIFVVSDNGMGFNNKDPDFSGFGHWLSVTNYYDEVLVTNAFGSYRDLLSDMTFSPVMGAFLSHLHNRKADIPNSRFPDENYGREILQLFSIGLYELEQDGRLKRTRQGNIIPAYTNAEVKTLARLFTGFAYNNDVQSIYGGMNYNLPMRIWAPEHDNNLNYAENTEAPNQIDHDAPAHKRIFGVTLPAIPEQPTSQHVIDEIESGLDVIYAHANVGPFIAKRLIQRMVVSNPSRGYIRRVARKFNDNGIGQRGDFRAVVRAILLDPELLRGQRIRRHRNPLRIEVIPRGIERSRLREPVLRATALIRGCRPTSDYEGGFLMLKNLDVELGQAVFKAPSVFGFYSSDYQPPGPIVSFTPSRRIPDPAISAPEFAILNAVTANSTINLFQRWIRERSINTVLLNKNGLDLQCQISFDLDEESVLARNPENLHELLERWDLRFCNGSLSERTKSIIARALRMHLPVTAGQWDEKAVVEESLLAVILSADCAVEQ